MDGGRLPSPHPSGAAEQQEARECRVVILVSEQAVEPLTSSHLQFAPSIDTASLVQEGWANPEEGLGWGWSVRGQTGH